MDFIVGIISLVFAVFFARAVWRAFPTSAEPAKPMQMKVNVSVSYEDTTDMLKFEIETAAGAINIESSRQNMSSYITSIEKISNNKVVFSLQKKASLNNQS